MGGQSGAAISTGIMKIAYQGSTYDSKNEGNSYPNAPYCHGETAQPYPAPPGYKETLTGISGVTGNSLTFINPWLTDQIMGTVGGNTNLYFYTDIINTRAQPVSVTAGALILNTALSTPNKKNFFVGAELIGIYYQGTFYSAGTSPTIPPNHSFYAIFEALNINYSSGNAPLFFIGFAAITNQLKDGTYYSGEVLLDGLWIRASC